MGLDTLFARLSLIVFSEMAVEIGLKICAGPNLCNSNIFRPPQGIAMNSKIVGGGGGVAW